jgi:hypothetical protein
MGTTRMHVDTREYYTAIIFKGFYDISKDIVTIIHVFSELIAKYLFFVNINGTTMIYRLLLL